MEKEPHPAPLPSSAAAPLTAETNNKPPATIPVQPAGEVGGPKGLEPTRYGDWEQNGRCTDF